MQPYSQQIPWVRVALTPDGTGYLARCEACGNERYLQAEQVGAFAGAHAVHRSSRGMGLGDAVAAIAKPIARAFGKAPCTPCEARRRAMNEAVPRLWRR